MATIITTGPEQLTTTEWNRRHNEARRRYEHYETLAKRGHVLVAQYDRHPTSEAALILVRHARELDQAYMDYCSASQEWTRQ